VDGTVRADWMCPWNAGKPSFAEHSKRCRGDGQKRLEAAPRQA